MPRHPLFS